MQDAPALRAAAPADEAFLRTLYRETRAAEFAALGWSEAQVRSLLDAQFDAQAAGYRARHARAERAIACDADQPVGSLVTALDDEALLLLDLALLPAWRGRGWGSQLLRGVQRRAAAAGVQVRLHVAMGNPALAWYRRHGFVVTGEEGVHVAMAWTPREGEPL